MRYLYLFFIGITLFFAFPAHAGEAQRAMELVKRERWGEAVSAAASSRDPYVQAAVAWYRLNRSTDLPDFTEYQRFLTKHPGWPGEEKMLMRAEIALLGNHHSDSAIADWLKRYPPRTAYGRYLLASHQNKLTDAVIIDTWVNADFTEAKEKAFLARYRAKLTRDHHIRRTDRLLWEDKTSAAQRMFPLLPQDYQTLYTARIKLITKANGVDGFVARVPRSLMGDIGLRFERMRYRAYKGNHPGAAELLIGTPAKVPYPTKWWPYRLRAIRDALDAHNYARAYQLASVHGQTERLERSEALWLKGWIALAFRGAPKEGLLDFGEMYTIVSYPISLSRAAYWAGRAAKASGQTAAAKDWFAKAAKHATTFYGQLALHELSPTSKLSLPWPSSPTPASAKTILNKSDLGRTVLTLGNIGALDQAWPLLLHLIETTKSESEVRALVMTGYYFNRTDVSVRAAKEAQRFGYTFTEAAFPMPKLPGSLAVEPAYALAIMRQESLFNPRALSHAGARGLMQLMPTTARVLARKYGLGYSEPRLFETSYNIPLGSYYLKELLDKFRGAHILATAGYNAGPGRPLSWQSKHGVLGGDLYQTINWIEMIPFGETRNYVQRVLENQQVYRYLLSQGKAPLTLAAVLAKR